MTVAESAELQLIAAKSERQKIARNMRIAAAMTPGAGKSTVMSLWKKLADMIERGDFSQ